MGNTPEINKQILIIINNSMMKDTLQSRTAFLFIYIYEYLIPPKCILLMFCLKLDFSV